MPVVALEKAQYRKVIKDFGLKSVFNVLLSLYNLSRYICFIYILYMFNI